MKGKVRRSLNASVVDGVLAALTGGILENYVVPFAIALQASASQIANIASLPNLVSALTQLQAGPLRNRVGSPKAVFIGAVGVQIVCILGLVGVLFWPGLWRVSGITSLMIVYTAMTGLAALMWGSLMCTYLPLSRRSGYFGWRSRFLGVVGIVATTGAGLMLHHYGRTPLVAFALLFVMAALFRIVSLRYLGRMHETHLGAAATAPSYAACLTDNANFRRFVLTTGLMTLSVSLSGPFLAMFMLRGLHFGYGTYTAMILASQITMCWMMGRWGRSADLAGNMRVVQLTARFLPLAAFLWILSPNPFYLFGVQLISGLVWAGYNLCVTNFVYDSVSNHQRVHATALFNTVNGLAIFAGAKLGGFLLPILPMIGGHRFYSLILLSVAARLFVGWVLFPRLEEVRDVPETGDSDLLHSVLTPVPGYLRVTEWYHTRFG